MEIRDWLTQRTRALFVGRGATLLQQFVGGLPEGGFLFVDDHSRLMVMLDPAGRREEAGEEAQLARIVRTQPA